MKKLGDNSISPTEKALFDVAGSLSEAQYRKEYAPESGKELEEEAQQRMNELAKPISAEGCRAVGAPAIEVENPGNGSLSTQLKNTTKSPNIVNAHAHVERMHLARETRSTVLAADMMDTVDPQNSIEQDLCHQFSAAHSLAMKFLAKAQELMHKHEPLYDKEGNPYRSTAAADSARYANTGIRLMKSYQDGALTLQKLRGGGQQQITVVHQNVQIDGGNVAVAGNVTGGRGDSDDGGR